MRSLLLVLAAVVSFVARPLCAQTAPNPALITALEAADAERMAAMKSGDRAQLMAIFSDDLRYAHSSGAVDTKASFVETIASGKSRYDSVSYEERTFSFPAPTIALMSGRARVHLLNAAGGADLHLAFLSVWREEAGHWRFLAWQSCKLPEPAPKPAN